jgi:hypothetical protein
LCEVIAASQGAKANNGNPLTPAFFFPTVNQLTIESDGNDSSTMSAEQMTTWAKRFALIQGTTPKE